MSAGQRQRIGLARALYGNVKLLLLDEPNSNLDAEGDVALMNLLQHAKQNQITTIIISHKTSIINAVDSIMVMDNGQVVDYGNRDEIAKKYMAG